LIKNSFLVALHGSTDKDSAKGYKIAILRKGKPLRDFLNGFLQGKKVVGRPCDIMRFGRKLVSFYGRSLGNRLLRQKKARIDALIFA
jgi:glucose/arabinose dehydrogenase